MTQAYWDAVADDYEGQVLSVLDHDAGGLVRQRIERWGNPGARAADLGCGVGKFAGLLATVFRDVEACDLSSRCLEAARRRCARHANIAFHQLDFVTDAAPFEPVEFVLCVNVLLMPVLDERMRAWRFACNQVDRGGRLVLVAPSHEAMLYRDFRQVEAGLQDGLGCDEAIKRGLPAAASVADLHQGVRALDGLRTKHYLREELAVLLDSHDFDLEEIVKLPYAPIQAHDVEAWDWLATARRR